MNLMNIKTYSVTEYGYIPGDELVINTELISTIQRFKDNTLKTLYKISVGSDVIYVDRNAIQKIMETIK